MKTTTNSIVILVWAGAYSVVTAAPSVPDVMLQPRSIGTYRPIKSDANTGLCLEAVNGGVVLNPCTNSAAQFWGPFRDSNNIYRFQNRANVDCLSVVDNPVPAGAPLFTGECTVSDGSGNSVTNAEFDIGVNLPPSIITTIRTHVGGSTRNLCVTSNGIGSGVVMNACVSNNNNQRWLIGTD